MKKRSSKVYVYLMVALILICSSMSIGGTVAWFTDSVTTGGNVVASGNLKVGMEWAQGNRNPADADIWADASTGVIFGYDRWEPGYVDARHIRVHNDGSLALTYKLYIKPNGTASSLADVIDVYFVSPAQKLSRASIDDAERVGTLREMIDGDVSVVDGMLEAGKSGTATIALMMQESAGNEYMNMSIGTDFSVSLMATQAPVERDSFGSDYDAAAYGDMVNQFTATASVAGKVNSSNRTTEAITIGYPSGMYAELPAGVKLEPGVTELTLSISPADASERISMVDDEVTRSFEVHIDGVASGNTQPMTIHLGKVMPAGLKDSSVRLYHIEDGDAREMKLTETLSKHNQFSYDSATGAVSICVSSFSEFAAVFAVTNPWNGTSDTSWYNDSVIEFEINTPEQLAGLGALVAGGNTFEGKTIKLTADLDLGGAGHPVFYPIGYAYGASDDAAKPFKGTFDGQGHRISDLYQNTWNIKGHYSGSYYNNSLGLFALIEGGTVRDVTLENFILEGEFAPAGCVAGLANGGIFENVMLHKCKVATYNTGVGGLIGWDEGDGAEYVFNDITIGSSNSVIALWGSWDVGCGGVMGHLSATSRANMTDVIVAARLDVYNDVCGNYQYYQYRYAGMLIGSIGRDRTPVKSNLICDNVNVYIGPWADYYYCEFEKNSSASYTEDFQFSRVEDREIVFDLQGKAISCIHQHTPNEDRMAYYLPFRQIYTGYGWGAEPVFGHNGVTVTIYDYDVIYLDGVNLIDVEYVTDNTKPYTLQAPEDATHYNWINAGGNVITSIPAGTKTTTLVYLNNKTTQYARFVDINGMEIYSEEFDPKNPVVSEPDVPDIAGYVGSWEPDYETRLLGATMDIIIHPIYRESASDTILTDFNIRELFDMLSRGETVVMGKDLEGSQGNASTSILSTITNNANDKTSDLVLASHELQFTFNSNANKDWTMFQVNEGSTLRVGAGLEGGGKVVFDLGTLNKNAEPCIFDIEYGGTVILERGVTIEIIRSDSQQVAKVMPFKGITDLEEVVDGLPRYPGLNIVKTDTTVQIIVTGTTTLVGNDPENN